MFRASATKHDSFPCKSNECLLQGTVTGRAGQARDGGDVAGLGDAVSAAELVEDGGVGEGKVARVVVAVGDAVAAQGAGAGGLHGGVVDDVGGGCVTVLVDGGDVAKDVALCQDVGALADLEAVAAGLVPLGKGNVSLVAPRASVWDGKGGLT